jgi:integrase
VNTDDLSYDVRIWNVEVRTGKRGATYRVRWMVSGRRFVEPFPTRKLADSFRSGLQHAASRGESFDRNTGRPQSQAAVRRAERSFAEVAQEFIDDRWEDFSPRHRKSTVEGLVTLTCALTKADISAPDAQLLRLALTRWQFNTGVRARADEPPAEYAEALRCLADASLSIAQVGTTDGVRIALRAIGRRLDGSKAAPATTIRKRAALSGVLNFAVESRYLDHNPLADVRRKREPVTDVIDPRVVVNPDQARALLRAVREIAPDLHAYFATLYYAAARPAEARNLRGRDLTLPRHGWGRLLLTGSYQEAGGAWTDDGAPGEERQLKHRARKAVRPVPAHPDLVTALGDHLSTIGTGAGGRLFVARTGRGGHPLPPPHSAPTSMSRVYRIWALARRRALTPEQVDSPLATRPYDLRHACLSTWLAAGVAPTQVAEWAGHGVDVLLRVYAKCLDNTEIAAMERIEQALPAGTGRARTRNLGTNRAQLAVASRSQPDLAGQRRRAPDLAFPQVRGPSL